MYAPIAASSPSLGITPASVSRSALRMIMNRISSPPLGFKSMILARGLSARDRPYDEKWLRARGDGRRQLGVRTVVGQIILAGEEAHVSPALPRHVVAQGPCQHGILRLERIEDGAYGGPSLDLHLNFASEPRQRPQMRR